MRDEYPREGPRQRYAEQRAPRRRKPEKRERPEGGGSRARRSRKKESGWQIAGIIILIVLVCVIAIIVMVYKMSQDAIGWFENTLPEISYNLKTGEPINGGLAVADTFKADVIDCYAMHKSSELTPKELSGESCERLRNYNVHTPDIESIQVLAKGVIEIEYAKDILGGGKKLYLVPSFPDGEHSCTSWKCYSPEGEAHIDDDYLMFSCRSDDEKKERKE